MSYRFLLAAALFLVASGASANPRFEYVQSSLLQNAPLPTDFAMGNRHAPIVMIEYASLSCPHCGHFANDVLPQLQKKYIDTGKMLYIVRPYPLNEPALKAAELVDCVGEQQGPKRYYDFIHVLFEMQDKWAFDTNWQVSLATIGRVGGASADLYNSCTTDPKREIKILTMKQSGTKDLGVNHTPYIFINSHRYDDDPSAARISAYIDKLLSAAEKPPGKKKGKK